VSSLGPGGGPDSPEPAGDDAALPGPASGDGPPSPVPASGDARAPRAAQVLIIDDEAMVARAIQRCLREHDVRIAPGGREALALLDAGETFDLVLCDLMMPELSGMDVYDAIRDRHPALLDRVVFMTGGTFTDRAQEFRASITNPFLEKPLQTDKLLDLVERRVGAWGGSRVA
jgi:DNA-binding NtrC family response regulator